MVDKRTLEFILTDQQDKRTLEFILTDQQEYSKEMVTVTAVTM